MPDTNSESFMPNADIALIFMHNADGWRVAIPLRQERTLDIGDAVVSPRLYHELSMAMAETIVYLERIGHAIQ